MNLYEHIKNTYKNIIIMIIIFLAHDAHLWPDLLTVESFSPQN